jgi:hypothetical protein
MFKLTSIAWHFGQHIITSTQQQMYLARLQVSLQHFLIAGHFRNYLGHRHSYAIQRKYPAMPNDTFRGAISPDFETPRGQI